MRSSNRRRSTVQPPRGQPGPKCRACVSVAFTPQPARQLTCISISYSTSRASARHQPEQMVSMILTPLRAPHQPNPRSVMPEAGKGWHRASFGTVDPRRRYKMSHRGGHFGLWHGRCLSISTSGPFGRWDRRPLWPGKEELRRIGWRFKERTGQRPMRMPPNTGQESEQLLLHSKQASDEITPPTRGFF